MNEYFTDRNIGGWGSSNETSRDYWPYGPFGLYYDDGSESDGVLDPGGAGSWTPITGGVTISGDTYGYDLTSTSYISTTSININNLSTGTGWKTTLEDLNISNDFWITEYSAGNFENSAPVCSGGNTDACYLNGNPSPEPNGDYNYGNWMHFWADDNGDVYHYNDQWNSNKYTHDHYMCIAEDNYETFSRFGLTNGPFSVIESGQTITDGMSISALDLNITTQIVHEPLEFDLVTFDTSITVVDKDQNISAGLFLSEIITDLVTGESSSDIHYFGDLGGSSPDFNTSVNGSTNLASSSWPSGSNIIDYAHQRLFFQYKYCGQDNLVWTDCWTHVGNVATCTTGCTINDINCLCKTAESNDFAVRPNNFAIASADGVLSGGTLVVKAKDATLNYRANDFTGSPTVDYNTSFSALNTDITLINSGLTCSTSFLEDTNQSEYAFADGLDSHASTLEDVGVYNFLIEEIDGQEFAIVDKNDTSDTDRYISPNAITLTIKPNHFALSGVQNPNFNTDGNFTYLAKTANLDNMAAKVDFNITAQNHTNGITQNYTDNCYASNINLDINYSIATGEANTTIYYKVGSAASSSNAVSSTLGGSFIKSTETVTKSVFTSDVNGSAHITVKFNFDRAIDSAKNPFTINLNNLNVSDQSTAIAINTNNQTVDNNATFVYGRVAGPKRASFTNCVDTPTNCTSADESPRIVFQIYKDPAGPVVPALNGATHDGTQDSRWWTSVFHDKNNILTDGNITTTANPTITEVVGTNVTQNALPEESNFRYKAELDYNGNDGYVKEAYLKHSPSPWLLYNPDNAAATFNTFEHHFVTEGWSGKNESDSTTTTNAAHRTNKRILW